MKKIFFFTAVVFFPLLYGCGKKNYSCIRLTQDYVEVRDFGYRDFYICSDSCSFLKRNDSIMKYGDVNSLIKDDNSGKILLMAYSPKIIRKKYFNKITRELSYVKSKENCDEGFIGVEFIDDKGNIINSGCITSKDYKSFKEMIYKCNKEFAISNYTQSHIEHFFRTIENGIDEHKLSN